MGAITGFKRGLRKGRRKGPRKEVAGPYRSQSSVPKIREQATKHEHRKEPTRSQQADVFDIPSVTDFPKPSRPSKSEARRMRKARRIRDDFTEALEEAGQSIGPQGHYERAKFAGIAPPAELKRTYPKAYKKAEKAFREYLAERENLKEDPLAEFIVSTGATAGVGGLASLAGKAGVKGAAAIGSKLAASETTAAEQAIESAGKGIVARSVGKAGSRARSGATRLRQTPGKVKAAGKAAPGNAKKAVATKEGRQAARRAELERLGAAGKRAQRKPVRYTGAGYASAYPLGADTETSKRANALAAGTVDAVTQNPLGTADATVRGVIGAVTGPLALGAAGIDSAVQGSIDPLRNTATEQLEGMDQLAEKLLSGDPKAVQKTVEEDVGLSYLAPVPAISRTKAWRRGRRMARSKAQDVRRGVAKRTGAGRVAPKDVESHVLSPLENRAARKRVAKQVTRATNVERSKAAHFQTKILKELKKAPVARSLRNVKGMEAGDLLQTLAEYGIRTEADVKFVREHGPTGKPSGDSPEGQVTLTAALDFAEKHPEILSDKHFATALDTYIESADQLPAALAGKGRRAKAMAQGDMFGIPRPEDRVPMAAREHTTATTRAEAWQEAVALDKAASASRRKGRRLADKAQVLKGAEREKLKAEAGAFYRAAKETEVKAGSLVRALKSFSRPGQALRSSARRKFYDEALLREYEADVAAARQKAGLAEPAWTHHAKSREPGEIAPPYPTAAGRVEHMRSGKLAELDQVDRSLRALLSGSVVGPRLRAGGKELARRFTQEEMLPVKVNGETKHLVTQSEWSQAVREGQYSPRHYVLFPARQFKQAMLDPFKSQAELSNLAGTALEKGLRQDTPGSKYVVVRREAAKEFAAQISPQRWAGEELINKASQGVSRWLLFSPAWMMIQSVAEAVPMAMAHPELLNPAKLVQLEVRLHRNQKLNPSEAKAFAAVAGEAPTSLHTPDALRPEFDSSSHTVFSDGARALTKSKLGQAFFSTVRLRPFGVFDNWRQGKYRELLLAAEADKQLNGWVSGLKGALRIQKKVSDELRGLPRDKQLAALAQPKYRKQLDHMADHVENIAGNWQSFTRFERSFAPFLVFYPFIRYSLRWPLTFARQHPVSATVATFLSQQNAEQIDKILGHAPANPLAYALPVWQDAEGEARMLPTGQRAAPGLSAPTQAVVSGQPSQALSVLNPGLGAALTGLTGVNAYTGRQEPQRGKQAVDLLLATSPVLRYFEIDSSDLTGLLGIDTSEPSVAGKVFDKADPNRRRRSLLTPWESIAAEQFKATENFGDDLKKKYSDPVPSVWDNPEIGEAIFGGKSGREVDWKLVRKLLREHNVAEAASDRVKAQEEPFFEGGEEEFGPERQKAMELLTGGIFIPAKKKRKGRRIKNGIGGGAIGESIGGSTGGPIGGVPLGGPIGGSLSEPIGGR